MEDAIFETVHLVTKTNDEVVRVRIPKVTPPFDLVGWQGRLFKRTLGDKHVEASVYYVTLEDTP